MSVTLNSKQHYIHDLLILSTFTYEIEGNWIIKQEDAPIPRLRSTSTMARKFLRRTGNDRKKILRN